jgi:beta-fructofuranosidase
MREDRPVTFDLTGSYVWDFWTAYDEAAGATHLFFLHAPRTLGDPDLRHWSARVGHATSTDLRTWEQLPDPLPEPRQGLDDLATWTGCTVRGEDRWWMFTTGLSRQDEGRVQRIGAATSDDLVTWERTDLLLAADPALYQGLSDAWPDESWRDPGVVRGEDGTWHMYVTARDPGGAPGSGVVGHATSPDLVEWTVRPPLSSPTGVFQWLEVMQVVQVEGRWVLVFSCLSPEMVGAQPGDGGVWSVPVEGPGAPVDVASAVRLTDERWYVGKVVEHGGQALLMAFRNQGPDGAFVGGLEAPVPLRWREDGRGLVADGRVAP